MSTVWCLEEIGTGLPSASDKDQRMLFGYGWWSKFFDIYLTNLELTGSVSNLKCQCLYLSLPDMLTVMFVYFPPT